MKIDLLIVATNNYIKFLPDLIESVNDYFLVNEDITIHVFTDKINESIMILGNIAIKYHYIGHKPWPYATLNRFHFFKEYINEINGDYVFYIDADTIIMDEITTDDIISDFTVVQHCGFVNGGGSWEDRIASEVFVRDTSRKKYYGGGFYGFSNELFNEVVNLAVELIDTDASNGIIPVWHDESVLNYIASVCLDPIKVLTPSYHYPENNYRIINSWKEAYPCKILLLDKNHKEIRG